MPSAVPRRNAAIWGLAAILICAAGTMAQGNRGPATIQRALNTVQPDLKFTGVTLSDALDYVRDTANVNVYVDWKALEAANIDRNTLINLHVHGVSLRRALKLLLNEAGAGNLLTFYAEDNVLHITTGAQADTVLVTMVYPVGDLLMQMPTFSASDLSGASSALNSSGSSTTIGGSMTAAPTLSTNSGGSSLTASGSATSMQTPAQAGQDLVTLIKSTIRPEIWKENGGAATIMFWRNSLIVNAPISVQEAIGGPVN